MGCSNEQHPEQSYRNCKPRYNLQLTENGGREINFSLPPFNACICRNDKERYFRNQQFRKNYCDILESVI